MKELGSGAFGVVFLATHRITGKNAPTVALTQRGGLV